ncbi:RNA exonuclease 4 [Suricata suricatta]|uniref:RNA exonuclease 4 n=1 Tax=Suricata suricatta TaxID=37032 RepID=UPI001155F7CF|nr:RNA exonuclease 4 [Suricata suricatta]
MAKALTPGCAPGDPLAGPGPGKKPARKKSRKRRFWKSRGRHASKTAGSVAVVRPPKAPEDFSQNWRALRQLLKQTTQAPKEPLVISQTDSKKQPRILHRNRKAIPDKAERSEMRPETVAAGGSGPSGSPPPTEGSGAEPDGQRAKKRANVDISPRGGGIKRKKPKAEGVTAALAPAPPTEEDFWFDGVDPADMEAALGPEAARVARRQLRQSGSRMALVKERAFGGLTRALAMDCEMVGVGPEGEESVAARVSIVNQYGKCVYDKCIKPSQRVTDYRTAVSGIRPEDLRQGAVAPGLPVAAGAGTQGVCQKSRPSSHQYLLPRVLHVRLPCERLSEKGGASAHRQRPDHHRVLFVQVLFLDHPKKKIRDTQKYKPFKSQVKSGRPSLKLLAERILGLRVQQAEHCSVQDAQVAMRLYVLVKKQWESSAQDRRPPAPARGSTSRPQAVTAAR